MFRVSVRMLQCMLGVYILNADATPPTGILDPPLNFDCLETLFLLSFFTFNRTLNFDKNQISCTSVTNACRKCMDSELNNVRQLNVKETSASRKISF